MFQLLWNYKKLNERNGEKGNLIWKLLIIFLFTSLLCSIYNNLAKCIRIFAFANSGTARVTSNEPWGAGESHPWHPPPEQRADSENEWNVFDLELWWESIGRELKF